jgi:hypothetical protein
MLEAAIALRPHTGWAALIVVGGDPPVLLERRRLELRAPEIPDELYHAAARLTLADAERLVARTVVAVGELAARVLRALVEEQHAAGRRIVGCAVIGALRDTRALPAILASHPRIHAAEGDLFRGALAGAARACGSAVLELPERTVAAETARALRITAAELERRIAELGRAVGPPWRSDHKLAAAAALLTLARSRGNAPIRAKSRP